jgi:RNA polymerase sigma-70 factor (ECF subfamily)
MTVTAEHPPAVALPGASAPAQERFELLHSRHCDGVWRYVRRLGLTPPEADDAMQQVFLVVAQRLGSIRSGSERSFVYEVASGVASEVRRRAARRYEVPTPADESIEAPASPPDELLEERRRRDLLDAVLAATSDDLRPVFVLFELEELSMKEIASVLGIPPGAVASRLRRAREEFKEQAARLRRGERKDEAP